MGIKEKLRPLLKPSSGIGKGYGKRGNSAAIRQKLKAAHEELKEAHTAVNVLQAEVKRLEAENKALREGRERRESRYPSGITELNIKADPKLSAPTTDNFRAAFDELRQERSHPRITDMRDKLGWSREKFDKKLVELRDKEIIQLHIGDHTLMTERQIRNSWVDELGEMMGTITWNDDR